MLTVSQGEIFYKEKNITNLKPHKVARVGISRTYQNLRLFFKMTVEDNVKVAQNCICKSGISDMLVLNKKQEKVLGRDRERLLKLVGLISRKSELAINLSFGEQKRLEIARALASRPDLILLDEPAGGMNPVEVEGLEKLIIQISSQGKTILLVEHNMSLVMKVTSKIAVLNFGTKIAEGSPREVSSNHDVIEAYLGKEGA